MNNCKYQHPFEDAYFDFKSAQEIASLASLRRNPLLSIDLRVTQSDLDCDTSGVTKGELPDCAFPNEQVEFIPWRMEMLLQSSEREDWSIGEACRKLISLLDSKLNQIKAS